MRYSLVAGVTVVGAFLGMGTTTGGGSAETRMPSDLCCFRRLPIRLRMDCAALIVEEKKPMPFDISTSCPVPGDNKPRNLHAHGRRTMMEDVVGTVFDPLNPVKVYSGTTQPTPDPSSGFWQIKWPDAPTDPNYLPVGNGMLLRVETVGGLTAGVDTPFNVVEGAPNCVDKEKGGKDKKEKVGMQGPASLSVKIGQPKNGFMAVKGNDIVATGTVEGTPGHPVYGILFTKKADKSIVAMGGTTKAQGPNFQIEFSTDGLPAGDYTLRVRSLNGKVKDDRMVKIQ